MINKTSIYTIILIPFIFFGCAPKEKIESPDTAQTYEKPGTVEAEITPRSDDLAIIRKEEATPSKETDAQKIYTDLWVMIQDGLILERNIDNKKVKDKIAWFARNQEYINRVVKRAEPYLYHIVNKIKERDMPLDLVLLPVVESAYQPFALSPSRASGIWQFIPATGKRFGLKQNWWYDGRRDVVAATDAALNYLEALHKRFKGDWFHALAAYNAGEGNVERAIRKNKKKGKKIDFWNLRLPPETRSYVPSLLAIAEVLKNNDKYNIKFNKIKNEPYFEIIDVESQIDLATVADLSNLTMDEIYTLNPGFNRWATDPNGPHQLVIPITKSKEFETRLKKLPKSKRIVWKQHIISKGESLGLIADKYKTSISAIKESNNLKGNLIREGKSLLIPTAKESNKYYSLSADSRRFRDLKTSDGKQYTYIVKRGDNLWDISRKYGVSVKQLARWSGISTKSFLRPKQKLIIWIKEEESNASNQTKAIANNLPDSDYVVKEGESLWLIARRFDIHVVEILEWNNLKKNTPIQPGQILKMHLSKKNEEESRDAIVLSNQKITEYVVKKGDSLWLIARRFDIHVVEILEWNNLKKNTPIQPGQILIIQKVLSDA